MSFSAYPEYKPSGFDWLPEIPAHWMDRKIARDIPFVVGWTPPSGKDEYYDGDLPWVTIADMTQMSVEDTKSKISHLAVQDKGAKVVPAGSMLFSFKLSVGKIAFLTIDSYTNEAIAGFLPCGPLDLEYWKYAAPEFIPRYGRENIYGATLLNQELISSVRFSAPARAEQTQIARFLDHETARIDALIAEQQRLIELLKEKRQAVISHAVTKGLNPTVPMKDSGVEWLGEVPAHWIVSRVKNVASFITSGPRGWSDYIDESAEDIFVQSGDMDNGLNVLLDKAKRITTPEGAEGVRTRLQEGDVVVCITGANTGRVAVLGEVSQAAYVNQHLGLIRPYRFACKSMYLGYALSSSPCQTYFNIEQYGLKEGLSLTDLAEAPLMVPPLAEQAQLVDVIEKQLSNLDVLTADSEMTVELLQERRSALISAAVTGKIDVRGWQPPVSAQAPKFEVAEAV